MTHGCSVSKTVASASLFALLILPSAASAAASSCLGCVQPGLGAAASYALLAGTTITVGPGTTIEGDVGVSPGTAVTGMPAGQPTGGGVHSNDASSSLAQADLANVYNYLVAMPCDSIMTGVPLGGATLTRGVHCYGAIADLDGILTLDAEGDSSAVFIFQVGTGLNIQPGSSVTLAGGAQAHHVWWQVGSSAVLSANSDMVGNVIAFTAITLESGATLTGRALARGAAVTIDNYAINNPGDIGTPTQGVSWGKIKSQYR